MDDKSDLLPQRELTGPIQLLRDEQKWGRCQVMLSDNND